MTGAGDSEDTSSTGFRLETVPGIFRRIAKRAETSRGHSSGEDSIRVEGRQVFKMSIGEANNPEDAHLFEEAIKGGYILLGFGNIDWSDEKFESRDEIIKACKAQGDQNGNVDARSGVVQMPFIFRNWVREGDIIIVSKGNGLFRAIGEFGLVTFSCRPRCSFRPLSVRRRQGFSSRVLSVGGADCKTRLCIRRLPSRPAAAFPMSAARSVQP